MVRAAIDAGRPLPKMVTEAPTLDLEDQFLFTAYKRLKSEGGYSGQIPWTRIVEYGKHYDLRGDELEEFITIIELISNGQDEHENNKNPKKPNGFHAPQNRLGEHLQNK